MIEHATEVNDRLRSDAGNASNSLFLIGLLERFHLLGYPIFLRVPAISSSIRGSSIVAGTV
jgi:hypothetical protein